ncbi:tripartite tricarboxylate transporter substrate binding protein [Orrella sp. 11846]|uniref:tripartite tricarboxylate transporter substrate binding protein n=1 Tax=Orrella sp. 11846 TaxID=3409913 RepID=UPI003B59D8EE
MVRHFLIQSVKCTVLVLTLSCAGMGSALADFPNKPVKLFVPFSPGGGTDMIARGLGQEMAKELGQPVVVENKPGGGTMIATNEVARSAPDGHTVVVSSFAHAVNPSLQESLPYGSNDALAPVMLIARGPNVLVVNENSPYESLEALLEAAKKEPEKLTYASQGVGTSAHLAGEMFANLANVNLVHVPYRGAGPAMTDLLGGHVDMMFATAATASNFANGGKLRFLGVTTAEPSAAFPDVRPIGDVVPNYRVDSWYGLHVPAATPKNVVMRLNEAAVKAAHSPDFSGRLQSEGLKVVASTPQELGEYVSSEEKRWGDLIKQNNIKAK